MVPVSTELKAVPALSSFLGHGFSERIGSMATVKLESFCLRLDAALFFGMSYKIDRRSASEI